jgi:pimeloyl-ACP methyl ester carboxylesterase
MPVVAVAGNVEIFYSEHGRGPTVLLLDGWTCDGADWSWLAADLAVDHRVVIVDLRGHGRSTQTVDPYGAQVLAEDVARVLRHLVIDRAVVVGHSMGTIVAVEGATVPIRVDPLDAGKVAVDTVALGFAPEVRHR